MLIVSQFTDRETKSLVLGKCTCFQLQTKDIQDFASVLLAEC